jgi:predicted Zn-dependent protease
MLALLFARDGLTDDARLLRYVNLVGRTVAGAGFRFAVTRSDAPYTRCFPGRYVAVSQGLLLLVRSEAELAVLLSREACRFSAGAVPEPETADPTAEARRDACAAESVSRAGYDAGAFLRLLAALQERAISAREKADLQFRIERFKSLPEANRGGQRLVERYRRYAIL